MNYLLLTWIQGLSAEQAATQIQGREPGYVTRGQFLDYLRDGSLLAALANRLQPESIQKIFVGEELKEKANQKANIEAFLQFAKEKAGMESDQVF